MIRRLVNLSLLAAATVVAIPAQAETKLLFNVFLPPGHVLQNVAHDWAADVEKATGNNVKISFTAGNMAPPPQQLPATASGGHLRHGDDGDPVHQVESAAARTSAFPT